MNQIDPSDRTTASFGLFSRFPSTRSAIVLIEPSCSVRETRLLPCSQVTSRPWASSVFPFE